MSSLSRRALLSACPTLALLAGCSMFPGGKITVADAIELAGTVTHGAAGVIQAITVALPNLIPADTLAEINKNIVIAAQAADSLSANAPPATSAGTVQTVEQYMQTVLNVLAGPPLNALIPPPFNAAIVALAVLLPKLTAFANAYILTAKASPADLQVRLKFTSQKPGMTRQEAVAALRRYQ